MVRISAAIAFLSLPLLATAAPTTYEFDTVTAVDISRPSSSITGILRNQTTPTVLNFMNNVSFEAQSYFNRCIPVFLLVLEKPGRYVLRLTIDPAEVNAQFLACGLVIKE